MDSRLSLPVSNTTSTIFIKLSSTFNETYRIMSSTLDLGLDLLDKINKTCNGTVHNHEPPVMPCDGPYAEATVSHCSPPDTWRIEAVVTQCSDAVRMMNGLLDCVHEGILAFEQENDEQCYENWWPVMVAGIGLVGVLLGLGSAYMAYRINARK